MISRKKKQTIYLQFIPLTLALAKRFSQFYGRSYDDMVEEAQWHLAFLVCDWEKYDASKCTPKTYLYRCIYHHLLNVCTRHHKPHVAFSVLENSEGESLELREATRSWMSCLFQDLGSDAKELVTTILSPPEEIAEDLSPSRKKRARVSVNNYLVKRGWSQQRLDATWSEVQECLN